jgi:hypothetical protein
MSDPMLAARTQQKNAFHSLGRIARNIGANEEMQLQRRVYKPCCVSLQESKRPAKRQAVPWRARPSCAEKTAAAQVVSTERGALGCSLRAE